MHEDFMQVGSAGRRTEFVAGGLQILNLPLQQVRFEDGFGSAELARKIPQYLQHGHTWDSIGRSGIVVDNKSRMLGACCRFWGLRRTSCVCILWVFRQR